MVRFFVVVGEPCFSAATTWSLPLDWHPCSMRWRWFAAECKLACCTGVSVASVLHLHARAQTKGFGQHRLQDIAGHEPYI